MQSRAVQRRIGACFAIATGAVLLVVTPGRSASADTTVGAKAPILMTDFTKDEGGWQAIGPTAKVTQTLDTTTGQGSLKLDYTIAKDALNAMILPVSGSTISEAKSFRFSVKSDQATALIAVLQEKGGGRYNAIFSVPRDKWQDVALRLSDFTLAEGAGDPKDPDGKLDLDQIEGFGIADMGQFFATMDDANLKTLFGIKPGPHSITISTFSVRGEPLNNTSFEGKVNPYLDTFLEPQVGWIGLGGVQMSVTSEKPLTNRGLKAVYYRVSGKFAGIIRPFNRGRLTGADKLTINVASVLPATLLVQLEERGGGKYNATIAVDGRKTDSDPIVAKDYTLSFADFKPADDSKDSNGKLDSDQVYQVLILDITGMVDSATTANTLWIGSLRTTSATP